VAAQNNDTFGVLMGLGKITEGLAAISTPSYFLFDAPLHNNGTTLSNTSEARAASLNQGTTTTITITTSSTSNQSSARGGEGACSANTTPSAVGTDVPGSERV
jgi:hypothetical protein